MYTALASAIADILSRVHSRNRPSMQRLSALSVHDGKPQARVLTPVEQDIFGFPPRALQDQARAALVVAVAGGDLSLYAHFRGNEITREPADDGIKLVPLLSFEQIRRALNKARPGPSSDRTTVRLFYSDLWFNSEEIRRWIKLNLPQLPATFTAEIKAVDFLASRMSAEMTRGQAKSILAGIDYSFATAGDKSDRVWFAAREKAGLPRHGKPGRPPNRGK